MPISPAGRVGLAAVTLLALALAPAAGAADGDEGDRVTELPTLGPVAQTQYAGYASTTAAPCGDPRCSDRAGLFYWLAERPDPGAQPTVLWSNGGPGASSMYGFLSENGPYTVDPSPALVPNPNSWSNAANYLAFDHPLGVGLSFPFRGRTSRNLREGIGQLHPALGHVIERRGLRRSPVFLVGESYGGTYMPLLAQQILDARGSAGGDIRLGGVVIADGWVDPEVQVATTAVYAYDHGLISAAQRARLGLVYAQCRRELRGPPPSSVRAGVVCQSIGDRIAAISGRWLGNIGELSDIDYTPIAAYLNRPDARDALHARPGLRFSLSSARISRLYAEGIMDSRRAVVAGLLRSGVPVMVISGLNDAKDANFLGARRWTDRLRWPGAARFRAAASSRWRAGGAVLGYVKSGGGLTRVEALDAGHLAVRDQPRLLDLLQRFMAHAR